jgi:hypothetical protein
MSPTFDTDNANNDEENEHHDSESNDDVNIHLTHGFPSSVSWSGVRKRGGPGGIG